MHNKTLLYIILSCVLLLTAQGRARAGTAANWVKKGNRAYDMKNYDEAVKDYDKAGVDAPESALIDFNKGAAFYRKKDWKKAKDAWILAAKKAKEPLLTARALYNLGNCEYKIAMRQKDSDISKAVEACTRSIQDYQKTLDQLASIQEEKNTALKKDTSKNIEIVRLVMKSMMDEINRKKAEAKKAKAAANNLKKLIDRQKELIDRNRYFAQEKGNTPKKDKEISDLAGDQKNLADDTDKAADAMSGRGGKSSGGAPAPADSMAEAKNLLKKAVKNQTGAVKKLGDKNLKEAGYDQAAALDKMEKALKALNKQAGAGRSGNKQKTGQNKTGQNKDAKKEKQKGKAAKKQALKKENKQNGRDNTAEKIIEQERERRDNANNQASGGYSGVDKDW